MRPIEWLARCGLGGSEVTTGPAIARLHVSRPRMRAVSVIVALVVGSWALGSLGAEGSFYRQFQAIAPGIPEADRLTTPELVDTNNNLAKLTNTVLSLSKLRETGEVGGVGVQMSMDEVVEHWGKPPKFLITSLGQPWLCYQDVQVLFWPGTNRITAIEVPVNRNIGFERGLSRTSSTNEFLTVLGKPSKSCVVKGSFLWLFYNSPQAIMMLDFSLLDETNGLWKIELEPPPGRRLPDVE